jgi:sulfoxide reductase heme-binding subunit YedZ
MRVNRRPPRLVRRLRNHVALGAASAAATGALFGAIQSEDTRFRVSMATAYVALLLFAVTLAFGPVAAFRSHRYPVTTDIRRDVGIWAGLMAVAHVVIGLQVHLRGKMWEYFVLPWRGVFLPRIDGFGIANYIGGVATILFIVLLATSNDASFRRLGARKWQRVHQTVAWTLSLTLLHAALFQWVEKRQLSIVVAFVLVSVLLVVMRVAAYRARRDA